MDPLPASKFRVWWKSCDLSVTLSKVLNHSSQHKRLPGKMKTDEVGIVNKFLSEEEVRHRAGTREGRQHFKEQ